MRFFEASRSRSVFGDPIYRQGHPEIFYEVHPGEGMLLDYADREVGGRSPVFQLMAEVGDNPTVWTSMREEWRPDGRETFSLTALSFTFWWGQFYREKTQVLRAEWDGPARGSESAGQPHWHIDPSLMVGLATTQVARPQTNDAPLEELPPDEPERALIEIGGEETKQYHLSLRRMHLAMGGWTHPGKHPACWRQSFPIRSNDLVNWVECVLTYAVEQFRNLRVDEPMQ